MTSGFRLSAAELSGLLALPEIRSNEIGAYQKKNDIGGISIGMLPNSPLMVLRDEPFCAVLQRYVGLAVSRLEKTPASFFKELVNLDTCFGFFS